MVQQLLPLLPKQASTIAMALALAGMVIGLVLWLSGARFSRSLVTLLAVAIGAVIGLCLPQWTGWNVDGWATAVGGALVLGVTAYALHRVFVGLGLGLVLGIWGGLVVALIQNVPADWTWPFVAPGEGPATYLKVYWLILPTQTQHLLPIVGGLAMAVGLTLCVLWPRVALVLLYSTLGVLLLVGAGIAAVQFFEPQWLNWIPVKLASQVVSLAGLVAFGALFQWRLAPRVRPQAQVQT